MASYLLKLRNDYKCYFYVFVFCVLIGIVFSMRWLYPLYVQTIDGQYFYVPIRYAPHTADDEYFYYSHIREVIDGNLLSLDPCTHENKNKYSMHIVYAFSLFMCSLGGFLTKNTEQAYYFNYFVYPCLNFFLIYLLFFFLTRIRYLSILFSLLTVSFPLYYFIVGSIDFNRFVKLIMHGDFLKYSQLGRTPNILFTNIQVFILMILMFLKMQIRNKSIILTFFLSLILGLSSLTSPQNFFISYGIYIVVGVLYFGNIEVRKALLIIFIGSLVISLPGIVMLQKSISIMSEMKEYFITPPGYDYFKLYVKEFKVCLAVIGTPFVILLFLQFENKKFVLCGLGGIISCYVMLSFFGGTYAGSKVVHRGGELLFMALVISGIVLVVDEVMRDKEIVVGFWNKSVFKIKLGMKWVYVLESGKIKALVVLLASVLVFGMTIFIISNEYKKIRDRYIHYNGREFKELYEWCLKYTKNDEVAVTLDFDLLTNLIVYSPVNVYIPQVILSPTGDEERSKRFYETLNFYGFTEDGVRHLIEDMIPHHLIDAQKDAYDVNMALMQLVLYYGKYQFNDMKSLEREEMVREYMSMLSKNGKILSYKADYLIVSNFDKDLIQINSHAEKLLKEGMPIFENNYYKVYKLNS